MDWTSPVIPSDSSFVDGKVQEYSRMNSRFNEFIIVLWGSIQIVDKKLLKKHLLFFGSGMVGFLPGKLIQMSSLTSPRSWRFRVWEI